MTDHAAVDIDDLFSRLARMEARMAGYDRALGTAGTLATDPVIKSALTASGFMLPSGFQMPRYGSVNADPGAASAAPAYGVPEQTMLQAAYDLVRQFRTILAAANLGG